MADFDVLENKTGKETAFERGSVTPTSQDSFELIANSFSEYSSSNPIALRSLKKMYPITEAHSCQRWMNTVIQFFVALLSLTFAVAQFSTLSSKQYYCTNVSSFDPDVEEVLELRETSPCLAPPGLIKPGKSLADILTDELAIVYAKWSNFDMETMFEVSGLMISEEVRFFLAVPVAILAVFRCRKALRSKRKIIKQWWEEPCWKKPKAFYTYLTVKYIIWSMVFSTICEIMIQFIKFIYIGGINIPIIGQVDEVASTSVMSYMAFVIGINVGVEGCCWCAYIWNSEIGYIDQPVLTSILIVIDIIMDLLYFSICFLDIHNELDSDTEWYNYLVSLSEGNLFLYFTLLSPIYKISAALSTLDDFWYYHTWRKDLKPQNIPAHESSSSRKLVIPKLILSFLLAIFSIIIGAYLITKTQSHLQQASDKCAKVMERHTSLINDPMMAWYLGACYKGKVYPFVPIENYTSPAGEKLYCDCKYGILNELSTGESAVGFINLMRSLRWVFMKTRLLEPVSKSLVTKANIQIIQIELHVHTMAYVPIDFDLSASTNLQSISAINYYVGSTPERWSPRFTWEVLPALEVLHCHFCTLAELNICGSPNLKTLRLLMSTLPQLNDCINDLRNLASLIVKNDSRYPCRERCLRRVPRLPNSLRFLILDSQSITEIANNTSLSDIEMVSLWGSPVCGIYTSVGEWRNLTGLRKYCMKKGSEELVKWFHSLQRHCDLHEVFSNNWFSCMEWSVASLIVHSWGWAACQRDDEYGYDCNSCMESGIHYCGETHQCAQIINKIEDFCTSWIPMKDTKTAVCDPRWVAESIQFTRHYFSCDTACLEVHPEEAADCNSACILPQNVCNFLKLMPLLDTNNDGLLTVVECYDGEDMFIQMLANHMKGNQWAPEDFESWNITKACNYMDNNKDGVMQEDGFFFLIRNFLYATFSDWGYENRWLQKTCSHCTWYSDLEGATVHQP